MCLCICLCVSTDALSTATHAQLPKDQIVVIMDVDVVLLEDISYLAVNVKKGR